MPLPAQSMSNAVGKTSEPFVPAAPATAPGSDLGIVTLREDISQLPYAQYQHMTDVVPAVDLVFGGGMLILIVLLHAAGVRTVTNLVARRMRSIILRPTIWQADVVMGVAVFLLLALHLTETFVWSSALVYGGLVPDWRKAGFFAGNTYTTVGYGAFVLPPGWEMLAPIIAISGLFTFGWSGSVLVDIVARCQKIKDLVNSPPVPPPTEQVRGTGQA